MGSVGFLPDWFRSRALWLLLKRDNNMHFVLTTTPFAFLTLAIGVVFIIAIWAGLSGYLIGPVGIVVGLSGVICAGIWFNVLLRGYQGQTLRSYVWRDKPVDITMASTGVDHRVAYLAAPVMAFSAYVMASIGMISVVLLALEISPEAFLLLPAVESLPEGEKADAVWTSLSFMFLVESSKYRLVGNDNLGQSVMILLVMIRSLMLVMLLPALLQAVLAIRASGKSQAT